MYLPELNREDARVLELNAFGGINRKYNAQTGELAAAVNMSADEYPLLMTRQSYDVGVFPKTALMWHNNDRDMALVPALKSETVYKATHVREIDRYVGNAENGSFGVVYLGEVEYKYQYHDESLGLTSILLIPGKGYNVTKTGTDEFTDKMIGSFAEVTETSCIRLGGDVKPIDIPDVVAFKNPVTANIGTSTVICDEINGMWVLEYDKDTDTYTYNKVQQTYKVNNETHVYNAGTSTAVDTTLVSGGKYCHIRLQYDDIHRPTGELYAINEEKLKEFANNPDNVGYLVRLGVDDAALWFRVIGGGLYEPIDKIRIRICIPDAHKCFKVGDYIEITDAKIHFEYPQANEDSSYYKLNEQENIIIGHINGWHEVVNIPMTDGVGWAIDIETDMPHHNFINRMFVERTQFYDGSNPVKLTNDVYMANGMTIERKAPENVRFICSHMNRIWCNNGDNEIMCCARGNPYVWYRYEGNSLDSWAATVGGDGAFTGCINYGYPLFFKENSMLRISGTRPSNFGYTEYSMKGIKEGCHGSAVIVNDVLYYQGMDGIYAYAGSTPQKISDKVYRGRWTEGKACRYRDKYFLCVTEGEEQSIYTFDTANGLWHRERLDGGKVRYLYPGSYLHDHAEAMTIYTDSEDGDKFKGYVITDEGINEYDPEKPIEWEFETHELSDGYNYRYLKCVRIKFKPLESVELVVYRERDREWRELDRVNAYYEKMYWYTRNFSVDRTSSIRLKIAGVGRVVIDKIILEYEEGSAEH